MRYSISLALSIGSVLVAGAGCAAEPCDTGVRADGQCIEGNAGRVQALLFWQPDDMGAMIGWSGDGVQGEERAVLLFAAYEHPPGELRIFGGVGTHVEGPTSVLDTDSAFDVRAYRTELDTYTDPFVLEVPMADSERLRIDEAVMHEIDLDYSSGTPVVGSGRITGVLTGETALSTNVESLNMSVREFLDGSGAAPDFDMDGDGTQDSWVVSVTFTTALGWVL